MLRKSVQEIKLSFIKRLLLLCSLMIFVNCSAYFNSLYNGKDAFRVGLQLHQKKMKKFPDSLLVAPPAEALTKYDRAIEKSNKVIEAFPRKTKWHDDALFLMGKSYYFRKDPQKAIQRLRELQQTFPLSPFIPESHLYIGRSYIEDGNLDKAEETLEMVLSKFPEMNNNQQVNLLLVEIAVRREGRSQAIQLLEQSLKKVKSAEKRNELIIKISQLYIDMKQYSKAIPYLVSASRNKNFPEQAYKLDYNLLVCYRETGKLTDALSLVSKMGTRRIYESYNDEILLQKGLILKKMGRLDEAIEVFQRLCKGTDTLKIKNDSLSVKGRAYYELGMLFQKFKKDYKKASEYYTLSSKLAKDTAITTPSTRKVNAIRQIDSLRNRKNAKDKDEWRIRIGELFRYDLEESDSAYVELIKIYEDTSVNFETAMKALCAAAMTMRDDLNDTLKSDSLFNIVIDRYPSSSFAQLAQKQMNMEVTIKTRSDSANIEYKLAEEMFYVKNDVKGAIQAFYDIYKKYPDLDVAPKSLYAAAYFSDNVLQKNVTAKSLYEKICEKYKKSIYCTGEAERRLKVVNDSLAALDVLRKKNESQKTPNGDQKDSKKTVQTKSSGIERPSADTLKSGKAPKEELLLKDETHGQNEPAGGLLQDMGNDSSFTQSATPENVSHPSPEQKTDLKLDSSAQIVPPSSHPGQKDSIR